MGSRVWIDVISVAIGLGNVGIALQEKFVQVTVFDYETSVRVE